MKEEALSRFAPFMDDVPAALLLLDPDGVIELAGARAEVVFGYDRAELNGLHIHELIAPSFRRSLDDHLASIIDDPRSRPAEEPLVLAGLRKDESEFTLEIALSSSRLENSEYIWLSVTDAASGTHREQVSSVTLPRLEQQINDLRIELDERTAELEGARRTAESFSKSLETQADTFRLVLDALAEGVAVANEKGDFIFFNPAGERMLGVGAVESSPETWPEAYGTFEPDGRTKMAYEDLPLVKAIRGGSEDGREMIIRNPSNAEGILLTVTSRPVTNEHGELVGGVCVFRDITEQRRTQRAILEANAQLEQRVKERTEALEAAKQQMLDQLEEIGHVTRVSTLGEFAAGMAHEIGQPLTSVQSNAQAGLRFLAGETVDIEEIREILKEIVSESWRAAKIIRKLRTLLEKGKPALRKINPNAVIREMPALLKGRLVESRVRLALELEPKLAPVLADKIQLQQVILNLVLNGIEAIQEGGTEYRQVTVRTNQDDGLVQISVTDSGPGLAESDPERLFGRFYTTKSEGLGMGLSISRSIVNAFGGRIWAESNEGLGATFAFSLPFAE